jgi:hypothetical protein
LEKLRLKAVLRKFLPHDPKAIPTTAAEELREELWETKRGRAKAGAAASS